jgi:hypothetical protein
MTDTPFVIVQYYHGLGIRTRGPYPQELEIKTWQVSALVAALIKAVPRDASGVEQLDQIIAAARARRPRDRTNADRQRRYRQRRRERQRGAAKESAPA